MRRSCADTAKAMERASATTAAPHHSVTYSDGFSRCGERSFSRLLHNGAIGQSLFNLLPPSFLSGGPAQNVGPSVARDNKSYRTVSPSFVTAQTFNVSLFLSNYSVLLYDERETVTTTGRKTNRENREEERNHYQYQHQVVEGRRSDSIRHARYSKNQYARKNRGFAFRSDKTAVKVYQQRLWGKHGLRLAVSPPPASRSGTYGDNKKNIRKSFFVKSDRLSPTKISVQGPSGNTKQRCVGPSSSDILTY